MVFVGIGETPPGMVSYGYKQLGITGCELKFLFSYSMLLRAVDGGRGHVRCIEYDFAWSSSTK